MLQVLWFEDNEFKAFQSNAYDEDIKITRVDNLQEGLAKLRRHDTHYDLMLFDANYVNYEGEASTMMLKNSIPKCCDAAGKDIPWLVFTAGAGSATAEVLDLVIEETDWHKDLNLPLWYSKLNEDETDQLLIDIRRVVDYTNSPYQATKKKFPAAFRIFHRSCGALLSQEYEKELVDILQVLDQPEEHKNSIHLNAIRGFMEGPIVNLLKEYGIVPEYYTLNQVNKHLSNWNWNDEGVYNWLQSSFFHVVKCCQDGSHNRSKQEDNQIPPQVQDSLVSGHAPYLMPSIIHSFLNIMTWLADFMPAHTNIAENRNVFRPWK